MVYVYTLRNDQQLNATDWQALLQRLPQALQTTVLAYRRWQDRQASLGGKLLLHRGLQDLLGQPELLRDFQKDEYQRPFLPVDLDFNISHTEGLVVCALSTTLRVGIDIEKQKNISLHEFQRVFTSNEMQLLQQEADHHPLFFDLWTRKEAVMKADGRGFYLDPASFSGLSAPVRIGESSWTFEKIATPAGWTGHLATNFQTEFTYVATTFSQLLK